MLTRRRPQSVRSFGGEQHRMVVGCDDSLWEVRLLQESLPRLLTLELEGSRETVEGVEGTSVMCTDVHLL